MPEFVLSLAGEREHPFYALNDFARGYVEAAFFTNGDCGDDDEFCIADRDAESLHPSAVAAIRDYCAKFEQDAAALLKQAYARDYDATQAGRDLWFTANGHGVGYWDRDELEAAGLGDRLADAAQGFGESSLYIGDDGAVYWT